MTSQINVEVMIGTCMRELSRLESWSCLFLCVPSEWFLGVDHQNVTAKRDVSLGSHLRNSEGGTVTPQRCYKNDARYVI
jgi:hypothetical protein